MSMMWLFLAFLLLMQLTSSAVARVRNRAEALSSIRPFCTHTEPHSAWLLCDKEADGSLRLKQGTSGIVIFASIDHAKISDVRIYCTRFVSVASAGPRSAEWEKMEILAPIRIVIKIPFVLRADNALALERQTSRFASTYKFANERPVGPESYLVLLERSGDPHPIQSFGYIQEALDGTVAEDIIPLIFKDKVKGVGHGFEKLALRIKAYLEVAEADKALDHPRADTARAEMQEAFYHVLLEAQKGTLRILYLVYALFETLQELWNAGLMHCDASLRNTMILKHPEERPECRELPTYFFPKYEAQQLQYGKADLPECFCLTHECVRYIDMGTALELNPIISEIRSKYPERYSSELLMPCALYRGVAFEDIRISALQLADTIEQHDKRLGSHIVLEARRAQDKAGLKSKSKLDLHGSLMTAAAGSSGGVGPGAKGSKMFTEFLARFQSQREVLARNVRSCASKIKSELEKTGCPRMQKKWAASPYQEEVLNAEKPWALIREKLDTSPPNCSLYHMKSGVQNILESVQERIRNVNRMLAGSSTSTKRPTSQTTTTSIMTTTSFSTTITTTTSTASRISTGTTTGFTTTTTNGDTTASSTAVTNGTIATSTTMPTTTITTTTSTAWTSTTATGTTRSMTTYSTRIRTSSGFSSVTVVEDTTTMLAKEEQEEQEEEEEGEEGETEQDAGDAADLPEDTELDLTPVEQSAGAPVVGRRLHLPLGLVAAKDFLVVPLGGLVVIGAAGWLIASQIGDEKDGGSRRLGEPDAANVRFYAKEPLSLWMEPTPAVGDDNMTWSASFSRDIVSEPDQIMETFKALATQTASSESDENSPSSNGWGNGIYVMRDTLLNGTHSDWLTGPDADYCEKKCRAAKICEGYTFVVIARPVPCVFFSAVWGRHEKIGYTSVVRSFSPLLGLLPLARPTPSVRDDNMTSWLSPAYIVSKARQRSGSEDDGKNGSGCNEWESGSYIMHDTLLSGSHDSWLTGPDADHCHNKCQAAKKCKGYSFATDAVLVFCILFSDVWGAQEKPGFTSVVPSSSPLMSFRSLDEPVYDDYDDTVFETSWRNATAKEAWGVHNRVFNGTIMAIANTSSFNYCSEVCDANRCSDKVCDDGDADDTCKGISYYFNVNGSRTLCALYSAVWGYIRMDGYASVVAPPCKKSMTTMTSSSVTYDEWRLGQKVGKLEDTLFTGWWSWHWAINESQCFNSCHPNVCVGASYKPIEFGIWCKRYTQIDGVESTCHRLNWTSVIPPFKWMAVTT